MNAHARVDDLKTQVQRVTFTIFNAQAQNNLTALGELQRIAQQVCQDLAQPLWIAQHKRHGQRRCVAQHRNALALRFHRQRLNTFFGQLFDVERNALEVKPAGLDLCEVEDVVDDAKQRTRGTLDGCGEARLLGIERRTQQQVGHAEHPVHGRAQFMAHARHELALRFHQQTQFFVALGDLGGALLHLRFQTRRVRSLGLPTSTLHAEQQSAQQQPRSHVGKVRRTGPPRGRIDDNIEHQSGVVPHTVAVGRLDAEAVLARGQVGIGRAMFIARVDPVVIEAFQPIGVAVLRRRGEVHGRKLKREHVLAIAKVHPFQERMRD